VVTTSRDPSRLKAASHTPENRLQELSEIFAVAVGGFSVMDYPAGDIYLH
jgi:hypothetical protein